MDESSGWRLVYQVRCLFHLGTSEGWISEGAGPKTKVTRLWKAKGNSIRQGQKSLVGVLVRRDTREEDLIRSRAT